MVAYKEFNLLSDLKSLGKFDIVFCRNVLIYFDRETKGAVLEQIAQLLPNDGVLFLGGAETVLGITEAFKPIPNLRGVYRMGDADDSLANALSAVAKARSEPKSKLETDI